MDYRYKVLELAQLVRAKAEQRFRSRTLSNRCHTVSHVFHRLLQDNGVTASLDAGYFIHPLWGEKLRFGDMFQKHQLAKVLSPDDAPHCWVRTGGSAWDLTLTQFQAEAEPVSIIQLPDSRYKITKSGISSESSAFQLMVKCFAWDADKLYERCIREWRRSTVAIPSPLDHATSPHAESSVPYHPEQPAATLAPWLSAHAKLGRHVER